MWQASHAQDGDVGEIVLDAPPLNLFTAQMIEELEAAVAQAGTPRPGR